MGINGKFHLMVEKLFNFMKKLKKEKLNLKKENVINNVIPVHNYIAFIFEEIKSQEFIGEQYVGFFTIDLTNPLDPLKLITILKENSYEAHLFPDTLENRKDFVDYFEEEFHINAS